MKNVTFIVWKKLNRHFGQPNIYPAVSLLSFTDKEKVTQRGCHLSKVVRGTGA